MENTNSEKNVLSAFYTNKSFLKVKQCLGIGKMLFSFVSLKNAKDHIDCYLEAEEFGVLLMAKIRTGQLIKDLMTEKSKGEQFPKSVWTSPIGGNATGNNGKPISRFFTISPGTSAEVIFTAYAYPATQNDKGAFISEKGATPLLKLTVSCTYDDLRIMQYKWSFLEQDYMKSKWCLANMQTDYEYSRQDENSRNANKVQNNEEPVNNKNVPEKPVNNSTGQGNQGKNVVENNLMTIELATLSLLTTYGKKGNYCFKAADKKNNSYICVIEASSISSFAPQIWNSFKEKAEKASGIHQVFGLIKAADNNYFVRKIS